MEAAGSRFVPADHRQRPAGRKLFEDPDNRRTISAVKKSAQVILIAVAAMGVSARAQQGPNPCATVPFDANVCKTSGGSAGRSQVTTPPQKKKRKSSSGAHGSVRGGFGATGAGHSSAS